MDNPTLVEAFGRAVKSRRAELKITQVELGERAGLDRTYVSGVERGIRNPSLKIIGRLAEGLNKKPSGLLGSAEEIAEEVS